MGGIGLGIFSIGSFVSGFAAYMDSFGLLLFGRGLVGVGEASFLVIAPPFINENAPPSKISTWLAYFMVQMPFGTAAGYAIGGQVSKVDWRLNFIIDGILMLPCVIAFFYVPDRWQEKMRLELDEGQSSSEQLVSDLKRLSGNWVFLYISFGFAAYTFVVGGFATWAPYFLMYTD